MTTTGNPSITPDATDQRWSSWTQAKRKNDRTLAAAQTDFVTAYLEFEATRILDELRATEYARLDRTGPIYLDYTGGGLYAECQVSNHMALLRQGVYGNPHSTNPTSMAMTRLVERARACVLEFFNASPTEYEVVFTQNASGALKLVDVYRFIQFISSFVDKTVGHIN